MSNDDLTAFFSPRDDGKYLAARAQAFDASSRYQRTGNGRFLLEAWRFAVQARDTAPGKDQDFERLFGELAQQMAEMSERLLAWNPKRGKHSSNLARLTAAAGLGTARSEGASQREDRAVLARLFALQRARRDQKAGRPPSCRSVRDFERVSAAAAACSLTTARAAWNNWVKVRPIDGQDEQDLIAEVRAIPKPQAPAAPVVRKVNRAKPQKSRRFRTMRLSKPK